MAASNILHVDARDAEGPFTVEAALWCQPVGYRWVHSLSGRGTPDDVHVLGDFEEMADWSGAVLARAQTAIPSRR